MTWRIAIALSCSQKEETESEAIHHEQAFCFVFWKKKKKKNTVAEKYLDMLSQEVVNSAVWNTVSMLIALLWNMWLRGRWSFGKADENILKFQVEFRIKTNIVIVPNN